MSFSSEPSFSATNLAQAWANTGSLALCWATKTVTSFVVSSQQMVAVSLARKYSACDPRPLCFLGFDTSGTAGFAMARQVSLGA